MVRSAFDHRFPLRKEIGYYRFEKSPLSSDQILETYRQWETTDYSSLYAATKSAWFYRHDDIHPKRLGH